MSAEEDYEILVEKNYGSNDEIECEDDDEVCIRCNNYNILSTYSKSHN